MPERSQIGLLSGVALAVIIADQVTKTAIVSAIGPGASANSVDVFGRWFTLAYVENRGVAFGLLAGLGPILPWLTMLIVSGLLVYFAQSRRPVIFETIGIGLVTGGAIGNLVDRLRLGYVIDFIAVGVWPNFNLADSAITLGVASLIVGRLAAERRQVSPIVG